MRERGFPSDYVGSEKLRSGEAIEEARTKRLYGECGCPPGVKRGAYTGRFAAGYQVEDIPWSASARGDAAIPQPDPTQRADSKEVAPMVIKDIHDRVAMGEERYGTKLKTHNGRKPLWDLYQELLDAVMYIRQEIEERGY